MARLEEVFVTEGIPKFTFVRPPNFNDILIDVRRPGKPVIIEGQSGTGKTTCVLKVAEALGVPYRYLRAREKDEVDEIRKIVSDRLLGLFVIDDFHRLPGDLQIALADLAKTAAEQAGGKQDLPKLVLIGINQVGSDLIQLVPDIAKRTGIHRVSPGTADSVRALISAGCASLSISIEKSDRLFEESRGDYWLTQQLCQSICSLNDVLETCEKEKQLAFDMAVLRQNVVSKLRSAFYPAVKAFCRGRRFRPTNDPYYKLLRIV